MKVLISGDKNYLLRFDPGEEVIADFKKWAESLGQNYLKAASFSMLGAASHVVLAYYDLGEKIYFDKEIAEDVEIVTSVGNIAWKRDDSGVMSTVVHAHGTFSDRNCHVFGGHIKKMIVSVTCEVSVHLMEGSGEAVREFHEQSGLNLLR